MSSVCASCGRPADQFRDVVRVVNMRVEVVCRSCAAAGAAPGVSQAQSVPHPHAQPHLHAPPHPHPHAVPHDLHGALPPTGMPAPVLPPPPAAPPPAAPRSPTGSTTARAPGPAPVHKPAGRRNELIGLALVLLVSIVSLTALVMHNRSSANASATSAEPAGKKKGSKVKKARTGKGQATIAVSAEEGSDFDDTGAPAEGLEAIMTGEWVHPLAGPFRELPGNEVQRFGSYRNRDELFNRYCGSGHCGVDIGLIIGLPVMACRDGVIEKIVREPTVLEGNYLRIKHAGDVRTYYMHMDKVAPELELGGTVKAGQMLGTLGRTGIQHSAAHLHFMSTFESRGKEMYVDPEPLLVKARLVEVDEIPAWAKP